MAKYKSLAIEPRASGARGFLRRQRMVLIRGCPNDVEEGDTFSEIKRALSTVVSDRWQPGRSRSESESDFTVGKCFELELHVGLVVLLVLVPVILGGELIVRVGLISSHSQTSGLRERIIFYRSLVENHDVGPELVYDDWAARVISPCLVVRPYDDIEWKRVRCGRAPSRLQLSGRSSCSSSS